MLSFIQVFKILLKRRFWFIFHFLWRFCFWDFVLKCFPFLAFGKRKSHVEPNLGNKLVAVSLKCYFCTETNNKVWYVILVKVSIIVFLLIWLFSMNCLTQHIQIVLHIEQNQKVSKYTEPVI